VFREGIARAIRQRADLELVGETCDGRAALESIRALRPDVALIDVAMPALDGVEVVRIIAREQLPTAVVLLSAHLAPDAIYRAMALGASGYLTKEADREAICDAVAAAARGETRLPPDVQNELVRELRRHAAERGPRLSAREQEVLALIAEGLSAPEIAARLTVATATVKTHLQSLYEKLGVSDRAAAVATAMRQGLLE